MAAPSFADLFSVGRAEALDRRPELSFDPGDVSEFMVAAMAAMADHVVGYFAGRVKATYLDGAVGDDLSALGLDHWNLPRFQATPAQGVVVFTRDLSNSAPAGTIAAGSVVATAPDLQGNTVQYSLDADLHWSLGEIGPKTASVTAIPVGAATNATQDAMASIITAPFDSSFVVSNPSLARATIQDVSTANHVNGETVTISDGTTTKVFEYNSGSAAPGHVLVAIGGGVVTASDVAASLVTALLANLNVEASSNGAVVSIAYLFVGSPGAITETVANAGYVAAGFVTGSRMAGGADDELDADYRTRIRAVPTTLRRGTKAALEFAALTVAGVQRATAVEELNLAGDQTGIVDLYVSDASGGSSPPMVASVQAIIDDWRPAGIMLNVVGGGLVTQNVDITLTARYGTNTTALAANVVAAVTARINKLRIGESLSPDLIKQAALNVDENILSCQVNTPAVTVVPAVGQIVRAGTVTVH